MMETAADSGVVLWLRALRAPSLTAGAMPALVSAAVAAGEGLTFSAAHVALVFFGLVVLQSGVNLVNDLFDDESGLDKDPEFADMAFPLGSRVLQEGLISRGTMKRAAIACFALGAAMGVGLDFVHEGHVVLWLGLLGVTLGYSYTAPPLKIAYRGFGEPITFSLFGPVAGCVAYYVYTGAFSNAAAVASCVLGFWSMTILFLHHFPQRAADAKHGKKTPIVRLGHRGAGRLVPWILAAPYVLLGAAVFAEVLPAAVLAVLLTLPISFKIGRTAWTQPEHERAMAGTAMMTLGLHFLGSALLVGGLLLGEFPLAG